jgi:hypothetical protein
MNSGKNIKKVFSRHIVRGIFTDFFRGIQSDIDIFLTVLDEFSKSVFALLWEYNKNELRNIFTRLFASKSAECGIIQAVSYISHKYKCHVHFGDIIKYQLKLQFEGKKGIKISSLNEFEKMCEDGLRQFKVLDKMSKVSQTFATYVSKMCEDGLVKSIDDMEKLVNLLKRTSANIKSMVSVIIDKMSGELMDLQSIEKFAGFAPFDRDERFIKILQKNNADSWFLYLFLSDLFGLGLLKPAGNYHLFKLVKFVNFGFKSDIKLCSESKYNHGDFKKFPNILATFNIKLCFKKE